VVGTAWTEKNTVHLDLADAQIRAVDSAEDYERLPANLRLGVSYESFLITRRDFRAVWATPISNAKHHLLGVLSLNIDRDVTLPFDRLNALVRPAVRDLAAAVGVLADQK
jgi:hypothetical protein